jgi:hypothetical protein
MISIGDCVVETTFPLHLDSLHDLTLGARSIVRSYRAVHSLISDVDQGNVRDRGLMTDGQTPVGVHPQGEVPASALTDVPVDSTRFIPFTPRA